MDREGGPVTDRGFQYRLRIRFRTNLRRDGSTYFTLRAETGKGFDDSWNNAGMALGDGRFVFNVKSLALHQRFGSRMEVAASGLDFERGAGTDYIYASGDGHMTGYRAVFNGAIRGLPEKLAVTAGYVGDFDKPNFFSRLHMDRVNQLLALGETALGEGVRASAEVDRIHSAVFGRTAVRISRLWVLDDVTVEAVARANDGFRFAWSSSVSRKWDRSSRWRTDLIYADLPASLYMAGSQRILYNRGEIDFGKTLAVGASYGVAPDLEIGFFAKRILDSTPAKRWVAQAGINYQFAPLANRLFHRL